MLAATPLVPLAVKAAKASPAAEDIDLLAGGVTYVDAEYNMQAEIFEVLEQRAAELRKTIFVGQ